MRANLFALLLLLSGECLADCPRFQTRMAGRLVLQKPGNRQSSAIQ